jgi:hypothetical protein
MIVDSRYLDYVLNIITTLFEVMQFIFCNASESIEDFHILLRFEILIETAKF